MTEKKAYRPDLEPGFWPNSQDANNPSVMAYAIQFPLEDKFWQSRVLNAYTKKEKKN